MAEGWRGSLIQIRGDWEFLCSVFRFPCCNAAGNMCWMCSAANTGRLFWTAVGDSAGLRATRRTLAAYVAELLAQRRPVPPLFSVVIGVLLSCVMVDVLHCMDLGITAHVVANIFMRRIKKRAWGATTHAENCERLDDEIRAWYRQKGEKSKLQGKLTLARLRSSSGYPKLKAKGAATRHMASFTLELAARHCAGPSDRCVLGVAQTHAEITTSSKRRVCFCQMQRRRGCQSLRASSTCCTTACPTRRGSPCGRRVENVPEDALVLPFDGVARA